MAIALDMLEKVPEKELFRRHIRAHPHGQRDQALGHRGTRKIGFTWNSPAQSILLRRVPVSAEGQMRK